MPVREQKQIHVGVTNAQTLLWSLKGSKYAFYNLFVIECVKFIMENAQQIT